MSVPSRRRNRQQRRATRVATTIAPESTTLDFTTEYGFIRRDLIRILIIGGSLIALMIVLSIAQVF